MHNLRLQPPLPKGGGSRTATDGGIPIFRNERKPHRPAAPESVFKKAENVRGVGEKDWHPAEGGGMFQLKQRKCTVFGNEVKTVGGC